MCLAATFVWVAPGPAGLGEFKRVASVGLEAHGSHYSLPFWAVAAGAEDVPCRNMGDLVGDSLVEDVVFVFE